MKYFCYKRYDLNELLKKKKESGITIGLCIPTLNEEDNIGHTISVVNSCSELFDRVVVIDSGSKDKTCKICKAKNIEFYTDNELAKKFKQKTYRGKGYNLWLSVLTLETDVIIWIDADITNISQDYLTGLTGPFIEDPKIQFLKGYYDKENGGGRVTELMVRPYLNLFFPSLSEIIQPLSGEYGGRKKFLEKLFFYSDYSVEVALLIQASFILQNNQWGQVFLGQKKHDSRDLTNISICSANIMKSLIEISGKYNKCSFNTVNETYKYYSNKDDVFKKIKLNEKLLPPVTKITKTK